MQLGRAYWFSQNTIMHQRKGCCRQLNPGIKWIQSSQTVSCRGTTKPKTSNQKHSLNPKENYTPHRLSLCSTFTPERHWMRFISITLPASPCCRASVMHSFNVASIGSILTGYFVICLLCRNIDHSDGSVERRAAGRHQSPRQVHTARHTRTHTADNIFSAVHHKANSGQWESPV